ncbi:MAG: GumC family protein, partial [Pirellulales bacterium]|nr:GumC family protein [Pirellulales bacterium]
MNFIDSRSTRSQEASPDKMLSTGPEFDLREMFRIVFRRKLAILATVLVFTGISTLISYSITPRYTATVEIAFDPKPAQLVDFREVLAGEFRSDSLILTEIEKITSRNLTKDVVEKLNLARNPEFSRLLERKPGFLDRAKRWTSGLFSGLSSETTYESSYESSDGEDVAEFNLEEIDKNKVVDAFLRKIEVEQKGKSQVIVVGFTSESPVTAAEAVNTLAELYLFERLEGRYENVHRANDWISGRVQELRTKVEQAEIAVEEYRRKHGLQYGERGKLIEERISQRQRDLSEAGFARAEAEAKFRQVGRLVSEKGHVSASAEVLNSQLILNLRQQEAEVERRVGELSRKLKPGHPQLLNSQAELAAIKDVIDFEIVKIAESFKGE